jgi:hypothetical protein
LEIGWLILSPQVPRWIEDGYHGRGFTILNQMIHDHQRLHHNTMSLDYYLTTWNNEFRPIIPVLLGIVGLFVAAVANLFYFLAYKMREVDLQRKNEVGLFWLMTVAAASMLAFLAMPFMTGKVFTVGDLWRMHWPVRFFYAEALAHGWDFTWCPSLCCGLDLHGEGQAGLYHPLHWLLYRYLPFSVACNLDLLLSYPALFAGTYCLCRRWGFSRGVSLFGAFTFAFNSFTVLQISHMHVIAAIAHLPWMLWCCDVLLRGPNRRTFLAVGLLLSLLIASQVLYGHPQMCWMTALMGAAYVLCLVWKERAWKPIAGLVAFVFVGLLLSAVQLLPTLEFLPISTRAVRDIEYMGFGSLHPLNYWQLISPYCYRWGVAPLLSLGWDDSIYTGTTTVVLCIWLVTRKKEMAEYRLLVTFAAAITVAGFLLAVGKHLPGFVWLSQMPGFNFFRYASRYRVLVHFGLAVMAIVSLAALVKASPEISRLSRSSRIFLAVTTFLALSFAAFFWTVRHDPNHWLKGQISLAPIAFFGPVLMMISAAAVIGVLKNWRFAFFVLVGLQVADLLLYNGSFLLIRARPENMDAFIAKIDAPPGRPGERIRSQTHDKALMKGYRLSGGFGSLLPQRTLNLEKTACLRVAGVSWTQPEGVEEGHWSRVDNPLPRARLVCKTIVGDNVNELVNRIDLATTAIVAQPLSLSGDRPGTAQITKDIPGAIEIDVDVPSTQLLVLSEGFHPGWQIEMDGDPQQLIRVFDDFMGCVVTPGKHTVRFAWRPVGLAIGKVVSLTSLAFVSLAAIALGVGSLRKPNR